MGIIRTTRERIRSVDKLSDFSTLLCALLGLLELSRTRSKLYKLGRERREKVVKLEKELEELEFWEIGGGGGGEVRSLEKVEEERKVREKFRTERMRLRSARKELDGLRWERFKLVAEGVFAREFAIVLFAHG